jgi:molybdopterin molybdotransferase
MRTLISFQEALDTTLSCVRPVGTEVLALDRAVGRILSAELVSRVDCPSVSTSCKDGYAVRSEDLAHASPERPAVLKTTGHASAGSRSGICIRSGECVRLTTGAPVPDGADAVIAEELCENRKRQVACRSTTVPGRDILERGTDVRAGETVARPGDILTPPMIGLIASAGYDQLPVWRLPRVTVIATGDEVVLPGAPLAEGKLYAGNLLEICAWLARLGLTYRCELATDRRGAIRKAIQKHLPETDVFLSSGGAWGSEKDLILKAAETFKWTGIFHRVRMRPGKPTGFGMLKEKPLFVLPGGPPSNEMAFIQLALPALMKMSGRHSPAFPMVTAELAESVRGASDWTNLIHARVEHRPAGYRVYPLRMKSRLQSMALKNSLIIMAEGCSALEKGERVNVQVLESCDGSRG